MPTILFAQENDAVLRYAARLRLPCHLKQIFTRNYQRGVKLQEKRLLGSLLAEAQTGDLIMCSELSRLGRNLFSIARRFGVSRKTVASFIKNQLKSPISGIFS